MHDYAEFLNKQPKREINDENIVQIFVNAIVFFRLFV